jgi:proteasome lid subunit RPN8/RPN11
MTERLILEMKHLQAMRRHVRLWNPLEACGLLGGLGEKVQLCLGIPNQERSPVSFRMPPLAQWHAFQRLEAAGLELLAIYHSHPRGPDRLSARDLDECMYPVVQLLWFPEGNHWNVRGFRVRAGQTQEVAIIIA